VDRRYRRLCTGPATPPTQLDGETLICLRLSMLLAKYIPTGEHTVEALVSVEHCIAVHEQVYLIITFWPIDPIACAGI